MMRRALALAERGLYTTTPNPRVGCVITQGERIGGEGWHERGGGPHAEAIAAGVARVIAAMPDPNPEAARGGERLAAAGIGFEHGLMEDEARELNVGFVSRMTRGGPWGRLEGGAT